MIVGVTGIEPAISCAQDRRISTFLHPGVESEEVEPSRPILQGSAVVRDQPQKQGWKDLNPQPADLESTALPVELHPCTSAPNMGFEPIHP